MTHPLQQPIATPGERLQVRLRAAEEKANRQNAAVAAGTGATGADGADGSVWRSGTGAPSGALGVVGDWYLNVANGDVYEKTGSSTYTLRDNLTGPTGAAGADGADGADGAAGASGVAACQGRLTTESGVPVSSADRTAQSTIYFTPYQGNVVSLYNGSAWASHTLTERSLALSGLTSGKNYDVFLYDNSGTLTLELSAAWTNDTTRADALALQDSVHVKSADHTRRYLGTIRTTSTTTTEDSAAKRFVWNYYNRRRRRLFRYDDTDNWTEGSYAWRQAGGDAANQVEAIQGVAEDTVEVQLDCAVIVGAGHVGAVAIALDSTTTPHAESSLPLVYQSASNAYHTLIAGLGLVPAVGYHKYVWLERGSANVIFVGGDETNVWRSILRGTVFA